MTLPYEYLTHPDLTISEPFNAYLNRLISEERCRGKDDGLTLRFRKSETSALPRGSASGSAIGRRFLI
jgi:hypothetical protein